MVPDIPRLISRRHILEKRAAYLADPGSVDEFYADSRDAVVRATNARMVESVRNDPLGTAYGLIVPDPFDDYMEHYRTMLALELLAYGYTCHRTILNKVYTESWSDTVHSDTGPVSVYIIIFREDVASVSTPEKNIGILSYNDVISMKREYTMTSTLRITPRLNIGWDTALAKDTNSLTNEFIKKNSRTDTIILRLEDTYSCILVPPDDIVDYVHTSSMGEWGCGAGKYNLVDDKGAVVCTMGYFILTKELYSHLDQKF